MHRTSLYFFNNTVTMKIPICVLLVLSCLLNAAFGCSWMERYSDLSNQSLSLIRQMGGPITKEESDVPFPYKLYRSMLNATPEAKMIFIREGLKMIHNLYSFNNSSSDSWDADKTEHFLIIIDRQVTELNSCVPIEKRNKRLQRYFRRLKNGTLKQTGNNNTAFWELIRSDTKYHLVQLQLLAISIPHPSQDHQLHSTASATTQN